MTKDRWALLAAILLMVLTLVFNQSESLRWAFGWSGIVALALAGAFCLADKLSDQIALTVVLVWLTAWGYRVLSDVPPQPKPCPAETTACHVVFGAIDGLGHGPVSKRPNRTLCTAPDGTTCIKE